MQYISRLALTYLAHLYDAEEADLDGIFRRHSRVRALPGRLTEMLRRHWGVNDLLYDHNIAGADTNKSKNRLDHRHHAIDAAVIACTSRSLIQRLATAAAKAEEDGAERVVAKVAPPWPSFRDELRLRVNATIVSHKPDHGTVSRRGNANGHNQTAGKLHNETAYGPTGETDEKGNELVVRRVPITNLKKPSDIMKGSDSIDGLTIAVQKTQANRNKSFLLNLDFLTLADSLEKLGYTVVGPSLKMSDAFRRARNEDIDAALLDVNLDQGETSEPVATILRFRRLGLCR